MDAIGNTPLIHLNRFQQNNDAVFVKMEGSNPGGSMKDRTAHLIISELLREGKVPRGGTIIESSSGNMAIGLAQACIFHGLNLTVVVDPNLNPHTRKLLKSYGVKLVTVDISHSKRDFLAARLAKVNELLNTIPNSVWSNQYSNPNNPKAYGSLMAEIMNALDNNVDYLFVATSTCGSLMGCADYIKTHGLSTKLIAVDAVGSVLFGGPAKDRKIPGHGAGVPSNFLREEQIYDVVHVTDAECVRGCHLLLHKEAILSGGSSGGIVSAFCKYRNRLPEGAVSVLLFADRGERYLDTIYNPRWVQENIEMVPNANAKFNGILVENNLLITENASL